MPSDPIDIIKSNDGQPSFRLYDSAHNLFSDSEEGRAYVFSHNVPILGVYTYKTLQAALKRGLLQQFGIMNERALKDAISPDRFINGLLHFPDVIHSADIEDYLEKEVGEPLEPITRSSSVYDANYCLGDGYIYEASSVISLFKQSTSPVSPITRYPIRKEQLYIHPLLPKLLEALNQSSDVRLSEWFDQYQLPIPTASIRSTSTSIVNRAFRQMNTRLHVNRLFNCWMTLTGFLNSFVQSFGRELSFLRSMVHYTSVCLDFLRQYTREHDSAYRQFIIPAFFVSWLPQALYTIWLTPFLGYQKMEQTLFNYHLLVQLGSGLITIHQSRNILPSILRSNYYPSMAFLATSGLSLFSFYQRSQQDGFGNAMLIGTSELPWVYLFCQFLHQYFSQNSNWVEQLGKMLLIMISISLLSWESSSADSSLTILVNSLSYALQIFSPIIYNFFSGQSNERRSDTESRSFLSSAIRTYGIFNNSTLPQSSNSEIEPDYRLQPSYI